MKHAAVWRGDELRGRADWSYVLTQEDREALRRLLVDQAKTPVEEMSLDQVDLGSFGEHLRQVQHNLEHGSGAHMIRGLLEDDIAEEQARRIFWAIALHLGTPVSQSARGERIFSVRDEGYQIGQPEARGPNTRKRLSFHTDRCDVIAFLCLKQARSGGENQIVSSMALYNEIRARRPEVLATLMQPYYYRRHNVDMGNEKPWCSQPIFSFHQGHFAASFLRVLIERAYALPELPDMTEQQRAALDYLEEVAGEPAMHLTFRQEPGDLLLLNNWVTLHRRNEFEDYEEPQMRRHLLRIWLAVPNSRPLAPDFEANYGATAAGAIRGGMKPMQTSS